MRFDMFGRYIGKDKSIEADELVAMGQGTLRRHFEYGIVAFRIHRLAQKLLHEESAGHAHLVKVWPRFVAYLESYRIRQSGFVPCFFEDRIQYLHRRTLALGAGDAYNFYFSGREAVYDGAPKSQLPVIDRIKEIKDAVRNEPAGF